MKIRLVLILWGLAMLLAGCEKEGLLGGSGEKVRVNISLGDIVYKGNETVTRGSHSEAETVRVPLGNGLYLSATIEEDAEDAPIRDATTLENGVKVRVVAYKGSTVEATAEYTVASGALISTTGIEVSTGNTYNFVAYSYNSIASPAYSSPTITVDPSNDLLWGSYTQPIDDENNEVSITMSHKFSQVRVKAMSTNVPDQPDITSMTGVTVTPGNAADLTIRTGDMGKNAAAFTQNVSWSNWTDGTVVTSDYTIVYTSDTNPFYVNIGSVTLDGYDTPFTNAKAGFYKGLAEGTSYTLVIDFQETIWARSNIYWVSTGTSTGYLTFDTTESGHEGYHGVFFSWGSLAGVSPRSYTHIQELVYAPTVDGLGWEAIEGSNFFQKRGFGGGGALYAGIYWAKNMYGSEIGDDDPITVTGDICRYINPEYRLPKQGEFGSLNTTWAAGTPDGWVRKGNFEAFTIPTTNYYGTYDLIANGCTYLENTSMGVRLPAAGRRNAGNIGGSSLGSFVTAEVGTVGHYWTSAPATILQSIEFFFDATKVYPQWAGACRSETPLPVRCVKNN
jgi:hypothetical protein